MKNISDIIELINNSEETFMKIVSANDAGLTGGHQGGIYIPKNTVSMFFDVPGVKGKNKEQFINIEWYDNSKTESRLIYYGQGSRNEYRITRLGKKLTLDSLFVLVRIENENYKGFLISKDEVDSFLSTLNIESNSVIQKGIIFKRNPTKLTTQTELDIFESNDKTHVANFKSRARLLPQLGDMLIKSEDVAFLELLKNSYDADASNVTVLMDKIDQPNDGIILIEDNGFGMDVNTILDVWLELGSDFKSVQLNKLKNIPKGEKGRIPIGEKGIGRLGAHKLGHKIELISKKINKNEVHVNINWNDFDEIVKNGESHEKKYIEDVSIDVVEKEIPTHFIKKDAQGTFICISDLKFEWTRGKLRNIQRTITSISSPFHGVNEEFKVELKVLDKPGWLDDVVSWDNIKDLALYHFKAVINQNYIENFEYKFKPYKTFDKVDKRIRKFDIEKPNELNDELILSHHLLKRRDEHNNKESFSLSPDDVGKVEVEGYVFDLENYVLKEVFDKKGLKEFLKSNSGVKVFRDGMRIYNYGEPDNDWLDLNLKRVNSPGEKISNNIIVCGVFLDREASHGLIEKTNREGFIENEHSKNFKDAVSQTIEITELLRKFDKKELRDKYGPTKSSEPVLSSIGKLQNYVTEKVLDLTVAKEINTHLSEIEDRYKLMQERLLRTSSAGLGLGIVLHEVEKVIKELYEIVRNDPTVIGNVLGLVKRLSKLIKGYSEMFSNSVTENVSINTLMEDSLFSIEFRLRKHKVNIIKSYEKKGDLTLKVSKGLVEGIIINIIDNSIYWLEVAKEEHKSISEKKLFIDVIENENTIEIIFADNGTGFLIPTDKAIEPLETGKKVGLGLGLNIANEIMLSQNGKLDFPDFMDYDIPNEFKKGALVSLLFTK
jgi:hypothetical protein